METKAIREARAWLKSRGGEAAWATTRTGGRILLAQGESMPVTRATIKRMCEMNLLERITTDNGLIRYKLTKLGDSK